MKCSIYSFFILSFLIWTTLAIPFTRLRYFTSAAFLFYFLLVRVNYLDKNTPLNKGWSTWYLMSRCFIKSYSGSFSSPSQALKCLFQFLSFQLYVYSSTFLCCTSPEFQTVHPNYVANHLHLVLVLYAIYINTWLGYFVIYRALCICSFSMDLRSFMMISNNIIFVHTLFIFR